MKNLKTLVVLLALFAISFSCNSPKSAEEIKQDLFMQECSHPTYYLQVAAQGTPKFKNILSSKVKGVTLELGIKNNASFATIKDIKIKVKFKAKTGATITERIVNVYDYVAPNSVINHKAEISISNQDYKSTSNLDIEILGASCK